MKSFLLILVLGAMVGSALCASCSCPQCIIMSPICASSYKLPRRTFLSECEMRCYNRCHGTDYYKVSNGLKC